MIAKNAFTTRARAHKAPIFNRRGAREILRQARALGVPLTMHELTVAVQWTSHFDGQSAK